MKTKLFLTIFLGLFFFQVNNVLACTSIEIDVPLSKKELKKYFLEEFDGAIFIGKVISIKEEINIRQQKDFVLMDEFTIQVEKYWVGVDQPQIKVYAHSGKENCDAYFDIGKTYLFRQQKMGEILWAGVGKPLEIDLKKDKSNLKAFFDEVFGPAKVFTKDK